METSAIRIDLPKDEALRLEEIQNFLKPILKVTYVSKASAIGYMVRSFNLPATENQQS